MNVKFLENTEDIFTSTLEWLGLAWWVEIVTDNPCCTYYFGPFASEKEAKVSLGGYIEDLEEEEAQIITIDIKRGKPKELTICEDEWPESNDS